MSTKHYPGTIEERGNVELSTLTALGVALLFVLGFVNGTNDVSKGIATLAGSGESSLPGAIGWGAVWTALGSMSGIFWGGAVFHNITTGLYTEGTSLPEAASIAVIAAATGWVLLSSLVGWPVSTTHAILGGLLGAGAATVGMESVSWGHAAKTLLLPLLLSPFLAGIMAFLATGIFQRSEKSSGGYKICLFPVPERIPGTSGTATLERTEACLVCPDDSRPAPAFAGFRIGSGLLHWISGGLLSFARGLNDTPKFVALALLAIPAGENLPTSPLFLVAALAIGAGSWYGGKRVTTVMSFKIAKMDRHQGLLANAVSTLLVIGATPLGLPVSTTHVSAGAIMGSGVTGEGGIFWPTVRSMTTAWCVTVPVSAFFAEILVWTL